MRGHALVDEPRDGVDEERPDPAVPERLRAVVSHPDRNLQLLQRPDPPALGRRQ